MNALHPSTHFRRSEEVARAKMPADNCHESADVSHDDNPPFMLGLPRANAVASPHATKDHNITRSGVWVYRATREWPWLACFGMH